MFPDNGHGPCSDCQQEGFDPWDLIAVPLYYAIVGAYVVRDFISALWRSKS